MLGRDDGEALGLGDGLCVANAPSPGPALTGEADGSLLGEELGVIEGEADGSLLGEELGVIEGSADTEGLSLGEPVGCPVGADVGADDTLGLADGRFFVVGLLDTEGGADGESDKTFEGLEEGSWLGSLDGAIDGDAEGSGLEVTKREKEVEYIL